MPLRRFFSDEEKFAIVRVTTRADDNPTARMLRPPRNSQI
jgi:hypothetical protein